MFDDLDEDDLYVELIMQRTNDPRAFILVEGPTDCAVLEAFANNAHFTTVPAHGKDRLLRAIARVDASGNLPYVFAVLDRDWVGLLEQGLEHQAVAYTDSYDLDAVIFFSPGVYERLAATFCTDLSFKHGTFGCTHHDISTACIELALPLGVLRFISQRDGLGLNLGKFPLAEVTKIRQGHVDLTELIKLACRRAKQNPDDHPDLLETLEAEMAAVKEQQRYCSGHDLAKAFSLVAKHRWAAKLGQDTAERAARAAFSREDFEQCTIYRTTAHWRAAAGEPAWSPSHNFR